MKLFNFLIGWPKLIASHFLWAGPLFARLTVGYVFMLAGWGKVQNLEQVTEYFASLGIVYSEVLAPLVSGVELVGGLFLILGVLTRISGGALAVIMIVAIVTAKLGEVDSLHTLLGFEETLFLVIFTWLAIGGAGQASVDAVLEKYFG